MKKIFQSFLCLFSIVIILIFPKYVTLGIKQGINLCLNSVIPSLMPFIILTNYMLSHNLCRYISFFFYPFISKLIPITREGCFGIIIGFLSGYPIGAKTISDLYVTDQITYKEANYLITFCNNCSISFLMNYIVFNCFNNTIPIYLACIYVYIPPIITGLINGLILKKHIVNASYIPKTINTNNATSNYMNSNTINTNTIKTNIISTQNSNNNIVNKKYIDSNNIDVKKYFDSNNNIDAKKYFDLNISANKICTNNTILPKTIKSLGNISIYIIIFSIISQLIINISFLPEQIKNVLICIIEITSGAKYLSTSSVSINLKIYIIFSCIIIGGCSITFQTFSQLSKKSFRKYCIIGKIEQLIIFTIIFLLTEKLP